MGAWPPGVRQTVNSGCNGRGTRTILRKRSWPAVSHSCSLTLVPSTFTFLVTKNAPVVEVVFLGSNLFWVYRYNRLVLPTPGGETRCQCPAARMRDGADGQRGDTKDGPVLPITTILASTPWSYRDLLKGVMVGYSAMIDKRPTCGRGGVMKKEERERKEREIVLSSRTT